MDESALPICFGEWVKLRRKELDLTQDELAGQMDYSIYALRKIEAGQRRPSKQLAELLAHSLKIPSEAQSTFIRVARGELGTEWLNTSKSAPEPPPATETTSWGMGIPAQLTPLLGREAELAALNKLLNDAQCRLLTITGMGGVGKTRLAIELASRQQAAFPGGICFVSLVALNSAEFIIPSIAEALGLSISGTPDALDNLLGVLAARTSKPFLLVLDSLEHLLNPPNHSENKFDTVAFLTKLLQKLPNLKILVTSLEQVKIQGEWIFELHGLPFPASDQNQQVEQFSAPALFLQHARRVKPDFAVLPVEETALMEICQLVEGNPLAIELAASWVSIFSIEEIAREFASDLDFLKTHMRDIPERHSSLRAALDNSWELLTTEEQQVLSRLAIFRGGFQREAAERVAGASLQMLMSLHSKSLLLHKEDGRFELNEIVRRYALTHLQEDAQNSIVQELHGSYYLEIASRHENAAGGRPKPPQVQILLKELDNFRAAMAWGLENQRAELSLQLAVALGQFWDAQGYWTEGVSWLERGLREPGRISDTLRAKSLTLAGWLSHNLADYPKSIVMLRESETLWRQVDDHEGLPLTLCHLGASILHLGDMEKAVSLFEEALTLAQQAGDTVGICASLSLLGHAASREGKSQATIQLFNEALNFAREAGDENQAAHLLRALGDEYLMLSDYPRAEEYYETATRKYQELGNRTVEPSIACNRGYIAMKQGDYALAGKLLSYSLITLYELGDKEGTLTCLGHMALLANEKQLVSRAIRLLGAIDAFPKLNGVSYKRLLQKDYDECLSDARRKLSDNAFTSAWSAGSKMSYEESITFASGCFAQVSATSPPPPR